MHLIKSFLVTLILAMSSCYGKLAYSNFGEDLTFENAIYISYPKINEQYLSDGEYHDLVIADLMHLLASSELEEEDKLTVGFLIQDMIENSEENCYVLSLKDFSYGKFNIFGRYVDQVKSLINKDKLKEKFHKGKATLKNLTESLKKNFPKYKRSLNKYLASLEELSTSDIAEWVDTYVQPDQMIVKATIDKRYPLSFIDQPKAILTSHSGFQLQVSEHDKGCIYKIIHTMGTNNLFTLLKKKSEMQRLGKEINSVPPLQFLGYIFTNPELKKCVPSIQKSHFKWTNFISGLSSTLIRDFERGSIQPELPGFAATVGADYNKLCDCLSKKDVEGFVKALM